MNCTHIDALLSASCDAPLDASEQALVDAHLPNCPSCVRRMQGYVTTSQLLRGLGTYEEMEVASAVPESLVQRILAARKAAVLHGIREQRRIG
jgi:predicted anti-sigma-YlaC factor YlaD